MVSLLGTLPPEQGAELLGARMVGRWRSGAPVDLTPLVDNPTLGADPHNNNNFDFQHFGDSITSDETYCPFSAHIRKVRPRFDLKDTNLANQAIRAGIPFGPEVSTEEKNSGKTSKLRGLAFGELPYYTSFIFKSDFGCSGVSISNRKWLPQAASNLGERYHVR